MTHTAKVSKCSENKALHLYLLAGGADSDIMLDLLLRCEKDEDLKFKFVWFDTGLEFQATKDHLKYLEKKYGITIERLKAEKPIPLSVRQYGVPFLSKYASEMISRLQRHNFRWEDEPLEELIKKYPNCKSGLKWWCNANGEKQDAPFNIGSHKFLKEFIIENPPDFPVSSSCCYYAKKKVAKKAIRETDAELNIIGVRKAEGGVRANAYKNCYTIRNDGHSDWRPLFWFTDEDKRMYEIDFGVIHSKCYTEYGMKRTGCVGCPFNRKFKEELKIIQQHEPKLYKACINIFGKSYEYTEKFRNFQKKMIELEKAEKIGFLQLQLIPDI